MMQAAQTQERPLGPVLALLSFVVFFAVSSGTMINVALPHIGRDFGVTEGTYGWLVTGFNLTFAIFSAVHGRLADVFGLRRLYLGGIAVFGLLSLVVAVAPTIEVAIALRLMQGAGAAAMPALGSTIVAKMFPAHRRGAAMGVLLGTVGVAASLGPFMGGAMVQLVSWRPIFAITGLALLAVPIGLRLLPESLDEGLGGSFDIFGALLMGLSVAGLMLSFKVVEVSGLGTAFFAVAGTSSAGLLLYALWVLKHPDPFTPPDLFHDIRYVANATVAFLTSATRLGSVVLVPILLTEVDHLQPLTVGLVLLPGAVAIAVLSPVAGRFSDRVGARLPVFFGSLAVLIGNLVTAWQSGSGPWGVAVGMTLYGIGFAFIQSPMMGANSRLLPPHRMGVGMGVFMMIFFLGGATGIAMSVTAVELQALDAVSWVGWDLGRGARYSNAMLLLSATGVLGVLLCPWLPGRDADL